MEGVVDLGDYPKIDAAGVADIQLLPDNRVRFMMFDWYNVDGVWRRKICGMVTRPLDQLEKDNRTFRLRIQKSRGDNIAVQ